jgi:hypothetical protein
MTALGSNFGDQLRRDYRGPDCDTPEMGQLALVFERLL